jgi:hypothetical protein
MTAQQMPWCGGDITAASAGVGVLGMLIAILNRLLISHLPLAIGIK